MTQINLVMFNGRNCGPKTAGGPGFRNAVLWNIAVIGKLVWSIAQNQDSLRVRWTDG